MKLKPLSRAVTTVPCLPGFSAATQWRMGLRRWTEKFLAPPVDPKGKVGVPKKAAPKDPAKGVPKDNGR